MSDQDVPIHLRVPAATKGAWIRDSRAAGMRLTDWIIQLVERGRQPASTLAPTTQDDHGDHLPPT